MSRPCSRPVESPGAGGEARQQGRAGDEVEPVAGSSTAAGTVSRRIAGSPGAVRPTPVGMNTETASLLPGLGFPTPPTQAARSLRPAIVDKALRCGPIAQAADERGLEPRQARAVVRRQKSNRICWAMAWACCDRRRSAGLRGARPAADCTGRGSDLRSRCGGADPLLGHAASDGPVSRDLAARAGSEIAAPPGAVA